MSYGNIHAFGLDISDYSVKIVSLNKKRKIEVCLQEELPAGIVVNAKIKDKQALADVILSLKEKAGNKLSSENVILSFPENKIFAHVFSVPSGLAENPKVILKIAQEHIPLDLNESIFDYKIVKDKSLSRKEKKVYFVAVEERLIFDYLEVLTLTKLKPVAIDIEPESLTRALNDPKKQAMQKALQKKQEQKAKEELKKTKKNPKKSKNKSIETTENKTEEQSLSSLISPTESTESVDVLLKKTRAPAEIVLDIGAKHSIASIFYEVNVFPAISIPIGWQTFTQILQENLKIKDYDEAQATKHALEINTEEYLKIKNSFEAEYDKIIQELRGLIEYFEKNNAVIVCKLHLSGGSSKINGLYEYFKNNLAIEVIPAQPCVTIEKKIAAEFFVNTIGLALRGISADPVSAEINLLPAHQRRLLVEQQARVAIIYSSLVVLFVSSLLIASFNIVLSNLYFDLEGLNKANTSFQKIVEGTRYKEIQAHIQELNDSAQIAKQTLAATYSIKEIHTYFYANLPKAILLNQFNYDNKEGKHLIEVNGFALTRDKVLELQGTLQNTPFYHNLIAPLSNLLKQNDIYFAFNFELNFEEFKKYQEEEKQKAIEAAKQAQVNQSNTTENNLHGTANNNSAKPHTGAFQSGSGTTPSAHTANNTTNSTNQPAQPIIELNDNLIQTENLENLNQDVSGISANLSTSGAIEDQQIEEVLKNSNTEYPFQDKIHEKVGDIFVIEQQFKSGTQSGVQNP